MMVQSSIFWWQKYGTLAQMAQATVALLGIVAILLQINAIKTSNRETGARQVFLAFTDLAFKNPKFSDPDYQAIKSGDHAQLVQYESFVSYFLYACEETIAAFSTAGEWQKSCDHDLKGHLQFLCEKSGADPTYLETYGAATRQWIKTSMQAAGVMPPDCKLRKS
jgi:hypothetical protein